VYQQVINAKAARYAAAWVAGAGLARFSAWPTAGASVAGYPQIAVGAEGNALGIGFEPDQGETVPWVDQRDVPAVPGAHAKCHGPRPVREP